MPKKLPVTVLSGGLGSGKATLLKSILSNRDQLKAAVIVNDMSEINIDSQLVKNKINKNISTSMILFFNSVLIFRYKIKHLRIRTLICNTFFFCSI